MFKDRVNADSVAGGNEQMKQKLPMVIDSDSQHYRHPAECDHCHGMGGLYDTNPADPLLPCEQCESTGMHPLPLSEVIRDVRLTWRPK